jgi:Fur family ferric uptake transcriptional regulator
MSQLERSVRKGIEEELKSAGFRSTASRKAVLKVLDESRVHLRLDEVLERGRRIHPSLGRATVYRTLDLLTRLGIMRPLYAGEEGPRYARTEGGHHHLVCTVCGKVIEVKNCDGCEPPRRLLRQHGFKVESHMLEFYGRCRTCW